MEFKHILKIAKKNLPLFFIILFSSTFLGLLSFFILPDRYTTTGSFYITRETEKNDTEYFNYEGYYAQQTAQNYSNTLAGIIESVEIKRQTLTTVGIPVNETSLRKLGNMINVKKTSPQLITLSLKNKSAEDSEALWMAVAENTLQTANKINLEGDSQIKVSILDEPVLKQDYKSLPLNTGAGLAAGVIVGILAIALKEYLKEEL